MEWWKRSHESANTILFYLAAGASALMLVSFMLVFFQAYTGANDVSGGLVFVCLGIIALYAMSNRLLQIRCGRSPDDKGRWGQRILVGLCIWAAVMWIIYQARLLRWFGLELTVPIEFFAFIGAIVFIFTGSSALNFLMPSNGGPQSETKTEEADKQCP